jgi:ribosome-associated protein
VIRVFSSPGAARQRHAAGIVRCGDPVACDERWSTDPSSSGFRSIIRTGVVYLTKTEFREAGEAQTAVPAWLVAVRAAESKKATDIKVLDLTGVTSFADYFVISTGANPKQVQAISDEIGQQLKHIGELPNSVEGYKQAEWVLVDYGDLLIHVFSTKAREYYGLERLWRNARTVEIPPE